MKPSMRSQTRCIYTLITLCLLTLCPAAWAQQARPCQLADQERNGYVLYDLGSALAGANQTNDHLQVIGHNSDGRASLWTDREVVAVEGSLGGPFTFGEAIANNESAALTADTPDQFLDGVNLTYIQHAARWSPGESLEDLGTLAIQRGVTEEPTISLASAMSKTTSRIVGVSEITLEEPYYAAAYYQDGDGPLVELQGIEQIGNFVDSTAMGISDDGLIVGAVATTSFETTAFMFEPTDDNGSGNWTNIHNWLISSPGEDIRFFSESTAHAVNDHQEVVGHIGTPDGLLQRAFFYDSRDAVTLNLLPETIPTIPDAYSFVEPGTDAAARSTAIAINNCSQIIGVVHAIGPSERGAAEFDFPVIRETDGIVRNLNDFVDSTNQRLITATHITDYGQIFGVMEVSGESRGYILSPVYTDPNLFIRGDANGDGILDLTDAIVTLNYLFHAGTAPSNLDAADADDSGDVNLTDAIYSLSYLFLGNGAAIPQPYPHAGTDPTDDTL